MKRRGEEIVQIDEFREVVDVPWGFGRCDAVGGGGREGWVGGAG